MKRRLYRNKATGETKFLLDELLGWPERARVTPYLKELAIKLSTELSFGRAAEILSYLAPKLSTMTIWHITQEAGEILQQEGEEKRAAVFEDGEAPGGKEVVRELHIEGDGVIVRSSIFTCFRPVFLLKYMYTKVCTEKGVGIARFLPHWG